MGANVNVMKMKAAACPTQALSIRCEKICNIQHYSLSPLLNCHWVQLSFRNLVPAVTGPSPPASTNILSSAACNTEGGGERLLAVKQTPNDITACPTVQIREKTEQRQVSKQGYSSAICSFRCSAFLSIPQ